MKQLWMVMFVVLFVSSYAAAQDEVMSAPAMEQSVQPMPDENYGGQAYTEGAVVENQSGDSSCGCGGGGVIVGSPNVDCDCGCAPSTYYYDGCGCGSCDCGSCGCGGRMFGFRPMFGGFFGRSRGCCCY